MNWEQMVKGQAKDFKVYMHGYKQSFDQLNADIALLLGNNKEAAAPDNVKDKIKRDRAAWEAQWGSEGKIYETMRKDHLKEIDEFMRKQNQ